MLVVPFCVTSKATRIPSGDQTGCATLPFSGNGTICTDPVVVDKIYSFVAPVPAGSATKASILPSFDHARPLKIASPTLVSHTEEGATPVLNNGSAMAVSRRPSLRSVCTRACCRSIYASISPASRPGSGGLTTQLAATVTPLGVNCTACALPSADMLHNAPSLKNTKCIPAEIGTFPAGPDGGVSALLPGANACSCNQIFQPIKLPIPNVSRTTATMAACIAHNPHAPRCFGT